MQRIVNRLFLMLQMLLPQHLLTAIVRRLAALRIAPVKNWLIMRFVAAFDVDIDDVLLPVPTGFGSFNEFFTRELAAGARPVDPDAESIVSPVDGIVSAAGRIDGQTVFQAKGIHYSLDDLLATDLADADIYRGGSFATLYLAPHDYHRVHSPLDATLVAARHVPGHLYSVNARTVAMLPGLFTRNERLVCHLRTSTGMMMLIFVGALNVGSITTRWTGIIRPRKRGTVETVDLGTDGPSRNLAKGDLIGWFNLGSTVILLMPPGKVRWLDTLVADSRILMGQPIGRLLATAG